MLLIYGIMLVLVNIIFSISFVIAPTKILGASVLFDLLFTYDNTLSVHFVLSFFLLLFSVMYIHNLPRSTKVILRCKNCFSKCIASNKVIFFDFWNDKGFFLLKKIFRATKIRKIARFSICENLFFYFCLLYLSETLRLKVKMKNIVHKKEFTSFL